MYDGDWIKFLDGGSVKSFHLRVPKNVRIALEKTKEEACRELERIASKYTLHLIKEKQHQQTALEHTQKEIEEIIKKSEEGEHEIRLAADTKELGIIMDKATKKITEQAAEAFLKETIEPKINKMRCKLQCNEDKGTARPPS